MKRKTNNPQFEEVFYFEVFQFFFSFCDFLKIVYFITADLKICPVSFFLSAFPCNSPVDKVLKDSGSFLKFPNPLAHPGIIHSCPKIIALS